MTADITQKNLEPVTVLRAIDDLRRQMGFCIADGSKAEAFVPVESLDRARFAAMPGQAILTGSRARSLNLAAEAADICIDATTLSYEQLRCLADPLADKVELPALAIRPAGEIERMALTLAKHASLLPALLKMEGIPANNRWQTIAAEELRRYLTAPVSAVIETARAHLPLENAEQSEIVSFRSPHGAGVHLALVIGKAGAKPSPLVRVHSSCVTGDILGSLRCDCGDQLQLALKAIAAEGGGVLIYLHQEGRGIGITNKLRAYALQEQGVDTYEANLMLGFEEDERDFSIAAAILKSLGIAGCRLLTNNPVKLESLKKYGVIITERVPLVASSGRHNHAYLSAKAKKSGHLF